jgi:hypothetical protein
VRMAVEALHCRVSRSCPSTARRRHPKRLSEAGSPNEGLRSRCAGAVVVAQQAAWGGAWAADSRQFGGNGHALATTLDNRGERSSMGGRAAPSPRQYGQTRSGFMAAGGRVAPDSKWV